MKEDAVPPSRVGFLSGHETSFRFTEDDAFQSEVETARTT